MTELLNQAFQHASTLPPQQQDAIAQWLLAELDDERRWDDTFSKNPDALTRLANEARSEHATGDTLPLVPDEL